MKVDWQKLIVLGRFIMMKFKSVTFEDSLFKNCVFEDITSLNTYFRNCTFVNTTFYNTGITRKESWTYIVQLCVLILRL